MNDALKTLSKRHAPNATRTAAAQTSLPSAAAVLSKALVRAARQLGLSHAQLAHILGVSDSSIHRLFAGQRQIDPASKEGELAALLLRLYRSLDALVGSEPLLRQRWLTSYNHALNGCPAELIAGAAGLVHTVAYLDHARAPL